ncbi:polyprenol monophosphomannose synthase [Rathayibacter sp. YIM 133350]|uniref:polyprenol monophosphomannose synthase n=1 Tax=Rathayibacter sp. YIM 133350 TaxID=3131992 RepID=UPI00307ECF22
MNTLVVIPTYNERDNVLSIAARVRASVPEAHLLIVDDNSPDGTGHLADGLALDDRSVHTLHRAGKEGLGAAYRAGFRWALEHSFDVIVEMDADGSHRPEQLPRLLGALERADVAVGSRWVPGGEVVGWPFRRELLSRAGSLYARSALGLGQRDVTGGYRAYRASALLDAEFETVESQGYSFQIEMLWRCVDAGLKVKEVPITFAERERGVSKMSGRIVLEAMSRVTFWALTPLSPRRGRADARLAPLAKGTGSAR